MPGKLMVPPAPEVKLSTSGMEISNRTHHCDGGVEFSDAHSAGRVLAMEALVRDTATVTGLHSRLGSVGVQIN